MYKQTSLLTLIVVAMLTTSTVTAQSTSDPALGGYSPVSYIEKEQAERGQPQFAATVDGETYHFTDAGQRDRFLANPDRFMPAFGGYCAYAMAKNQKAPVDPKSFKVVGGRTFLYFNQDGTNTLELWNKGDEQMQTAAANANWEKMSGEGPLQHYNLGASRLGIQGYSPVAYILAGRAVPGSPEHTVEFRGVTYRFATAAEAEEFRRQPSKYEPAYGGWCATGMAVEQKFPIDPAAFKIVDGRLFLFKKDKEVDALAIWNENDEAEMTRNADAYWNSLLGE